MTAATVSVMLDLAVVAVAAAAVVVDLMVAAMGAARIEAEAAVEPGTVKVGLIKGADVGERRRKARSD